MLTRHRYSTISAQQSRVPASYLPSNPLVIARLRSHALLVRGLFGLASGSCGGDASNAPARRRKVMRTVWKDRIMNLIARARAEARVRYIRLLSRCADGRHRTVPPTLLGTLASNFCWKAQLKRSFSDDSASSESDSTGGGDEVDVSTACSACSRAS